MEGTEMEERYRKLGIRDALSRHCDYSHACTDLNSILRCAYIKLPKNLQALVFQDTLAAFRLLPQYLSLFLCAIVPKSEFRFSDFGFIIRN